MNLEDPTAHPKRTSFGPDSRRNRLKSPLKGNCNNRAILSHLAMSLWLAAFAHCAFPATRDGMRVENLKIENSIGERIYVSKSSGGSRTLPFWISKIGDEEFTLALKDSIAASGLFSSVTDEDSAEWKLVAVIKELNQPWFGLNLTVRSLIQYTLYHGEILIQDFPISASGTAGIDDALVAIKRLRLANEFSARENIRMFLTQAAKVERKQ